MITFAPAFRATENADGFGPDTWHYEEGVIGYIVEQVDYTSLLGRSMDREWSLIPLAQRDIAVWARAQGRALTHAQEDSLDREHGMHRLLWRDDADALAVTLRLWQRDRCDDFLDECDEDRRAIDAGELAYD